MLAPCSPSDMSFPFIKRLEEVHADPEGCHDLGKSGWARGDRPHPMYFPFLAGGEWCCVGCFLGNSFYLPARGCRGTVKLSTARHQILLRVAKRAACCGRFAAERNTFSAHDQRIGAHCCVISNCGELSMRCSLARLLQKRVSPAFDAQHGRRGQTFVDLPWLH